jgi:hypothetical protein
VVEGTYKFKNQWGAVATPLDWREFDVFGGKTRPESMGSGIKREYAAKLWRRLPLNVANMIGPGLRKYISL